MTSDEAGRPKELKDFKKKENCLHQRIVDYHYDDKGQRTGKLTCKECGAIIPDQLKILD